MAQREGFSAFSMGLGEALHGRRIVRAELRAADGIGCAAPAPFTPAATLPPARIMPGCSDLGPFLAHSPHLPRTLILPLESLSHSSSTPLDDCACQIERKLCTWFLFYRFLFTGS